ncbi:hypothetical protein K3495_g13628 [Podosphaera aphanis]|nr:hypothetical protein K3495_g13628 [Podosphaera aphanis]
MSQSNASLSSSVNSLRASLSLLESSISILSHGTADFPRLKTVLASTRHFELTPSSTLTAAQHSLAAELTPAIHSLLARAESTISKLERKEKNLVARSELLEGRLEGARFSGAKGSGVDHQLIGSRVSRKAGSSGAGMEENVSKLKVLKQKKERLAYVVERLTLQSQQRQRQLRKSIAAI